MFRKIVSNLPFSPALVGQLGFYANRLRKEEMTRRLGLVFIALTLVIQSLAVFQPPESANASSSTDMVLGGISSIKEFLNAYDSNTRHLKDIMNYTGITRAEIKNTEYTSFRTGEKLSWGLASRFSYAQGERQHSVKDASGKIVTTVYSRPLKLWGSESKQINGWVGHSNKMGWFAIMRSCGNLVTTKLPPPPPPPLCAYNPKLLKSDSRCKPCPGDDRLWIDDPVCVPEIIKSKTATNTTQGFVHASSKTALADDQISYTITTKNTGLSAKKVQLEERLEDVLQYSTLIDNGGGILDSTTKVLSWSDANLGPKQQQTRTFVVRVMKNIPADASGQSDPTSFDCMMTNVYGNQIDIRVDCPTPKIIEKTTSELPQTGPTENIMFAGILCAVTTYFYARSRQLKKETVIIRKNVTTGTI